MVACVFAAFVLVGCSRSAEQSAPSSTSSTSTTVSTTVTTSPPPNDWPSELEQNYLTGCRSGAAASAPSMTPLSIDLYCTCTLEQLQRALTAAQFTDAEARMLRGEASGPDLPKIASGCHLGA